MSDDAELMQVTGQLRDARLARGLSQRALAEQLGLHEDKIRRLEKGRGSLALTCQVADHLGLRLRGALLR